MTSTSPARERLTPADLRFLAICFLLLAGTVWFSARYFHRAFPEASIDFRVTRADSRGVAAKFLAAQGWTAAGYREASRFSYDENAKTFLERELGLEKANALMGSRVRLWHWEWRWFRPKQKEEFRVAVTPGGDVVGAEHLIDEAAALPNLGPAEARAIAETALAAMGRKAADLEFVEGSTTARPARTDHTFTWKERDFDVKGASYRIEVAVFGNRVGGYQEYLKVPDTWQRGYERLRSGNMAAQYVDTGLMLLLAVGLLVTILLRTRARDVKWMRAAAVGCVGAVLFFLSSLNSHPLNEFNYPTTDSYGNYVVRLFLQYAMGALGSGGLLFVLTAGAEPLYRQYFPNRVSLGNLFRAEGLRTKSFFLGTVLGLTLTGIFVAYQTGFYLTAYRFGAWSPADVPYDDLLNTRFPWLFVLFGGFLPAVSEEFMFRMFAIPWLRKIFRSTAVAVVLAGFLWGFGHAGYPQQPFWIRGVEVGIGGVALGIIMLRWGILPVLVWHYSVDALYTALLLMRSHNLYFALSGAASAGVMVLPAAVAFIVYLRRGGFEPAEVLTNESEGTSAPAAAREAEAGAGGEYQEWTAAKRWMALGLAAGSVLLVVLPVDRFGDEPRFALTGDGARAAADAFLRTRGAAPERFRVAAFPLSRWDEDGAYWMPRETATYLLQRRPVRWVADAYSRIVPLRLWSVRYYRPLEKEEYRVSVHPASGKIIGFMHVVSEDQAGAELPPDAARNIAESYLASAGYDPAGFELKETSSEKQKARRDHTLVWEARQGDPRNVDEARFRVRTEVAGDQVSAAAAFWKLPEAWLRARTERNALSTGLLVARIGVMSGAVILGLFLLVGATRRREVRWRTAVLLAIFPVVLGVAGTLSNLPWMMRAYNTAIAMEMFRVVMFTGVLTGAVGLFLGLTCACALILALQPAARDALRAPGRQRMAADALCATALAGGLAAVVTHTAATLRAAFHGQALFSPGSPSALGAAPAALSLAGSAAGQTVFRLAVVVLAVFLVRWAGRSGGRVLALVLAAMAVLVSGEAHTAGELALESAVALPALAGVAIFAWFARSNYLAWLLAVWTLAVGGGAVALIAQPAPAFHVQGWALAAFWAATLAWAAAPMLRGGKSMQREAGQAG